MDSIRTDTIGGVNRFIEEQKKAPGEAVLSLCLFDHEYHRTINAKRIGDVPVIDEKLYVPRGNTCLFGAIGTAIEETGARLSALPEHERPEFVIVLIVTDGQENSSLAHEWSRRHTQEAIKKAIEHQTDAYKWKFVYIGANQDAITNAANIGIAPGAALNYTSNKIGTQSLYASTASNVSALRSRVRSDLNWSDDQRRQQDAATSGQLTS